MINFVPDKVQVTNDIIKVNALIKIIKVNNGQCPQSTTETVNK